MNTLSFIIKSVSLPCLCLFSLISQAQQLPPVFDEAANKTAQTSTLTTTYLSPTHVVWKSAEGSSVIQNEECLLLKGKGQADLANTNVCTIKNDGSNTPAIILDFGREIHGGIQIVTGNTSTGKPIKVRIRFGESVSEAMSDVGVKGATNDHAIRDAVMEIPWMGRFEFGNSGFRFVRIDLLDKNTDLQLREVRAKFVYQDIPYLGSFKCNDELLNKIWMTGAYTVHLNLQDYLWDGIKRDRLVWIGDIHPEVSTVNAVFGYNAAVPRSLDLARDITPVSQWMNGISSYSLWWIITQKDWYMNNGDLNYLQEQKDYLIPLLKKLTTYIDQNGKEKLDGMRFLDWPSYEDPIAVQGGLQSLMVWAFSSGKDLCVILNEKDVAEECENAIKKLKKYNPELTKTKQAGALLSITDLISSKKGNEIVSNNGVQDFSTFYGYYMLQALAKAGNYDGAIESIRTYWGGMLSVGATTFWEDFNIDWLKNASPIDEVPQEGKKDIHADYGAHCYVGLRHSLCHGWASGPTSWLSEHVLGIKVLEPGCKVVKIEPHLGNLTFAEGTYPTPMGVLKVKHTKDINGKVKSEIDAPDGIKIIQ